MRRKRKKGRKQPKKIMVKASETNTTDTASYVLVDRRGENDDGTNECEGNVEI